MSITVLDPVPLTTVQDAGRVGYAAQGYRSCGAADSYAYHLANALVGNDPGAAVLESTLRGPALRFEADTVFSLTGAESPAALDGVPVPYYAPLLAKAGSTLKIGVAASGLRSYLAVGGGIATPPVLGSRATDVKCGIGGLKGRKLAKGDTLPPGYAIPPRSGGSLRPNIWIARCGTRPCAGAPILCACRGHRLCRCCASYLARRMARSPHRVYMILPTASTH